MTAAAQRTDASAAPRPMDALRDSPRLEAVLKAQLGFVWRCLRRLGLAPEDADDAAQQVFIVFSRHLPDIAAGQERAFLFGTAVRVAANARRKRQHVQLIDQERLEEALVELRDPEWLLERRRAGALLDALLGELPVEQRSVFVLCEVEGLTKPEAAALLHVPEGTVASRLRRARAHLQHRLSGNPRSGRGETE